MKKQETVGSRYNYNTLHPILEKKLSTTLQEQNPTSYFKNTPIIALRYLFYTNTDRHCVVVQFKQLEAYGYLYRFNITHRDTRPSEELDYDFLITSTYIAMQHPVEAIAQVVVDFMTSQPKVKLLVEKDTDLFQRVLSKLWPEFNTLFNIKGLLNGHWQDCEQGYNYDAYLLTK